MSNEISSLSKLTKFILIFIIVLLIISSFSNWKLFDIGEGYKSKINKYQDKIESNELYIKSLEKSNYKLDIEIDNLIFIIDSLNRIDTIYKTKYIYINKYYYETIDFINNASLIELNLFFSTNISPLDTLWKRQRSRTN